MCGIAGLANLRAAAPPDRGALARAIAAMRHRGPDEFGRYRDDAVGLAHARLSIVDLATGQQPMTDVDDQAWIVFNGEIFNHVELRAELTALGRRFRTRSDTEVILQAWAEWGEAALDRFNGQWAFALWTPARRELVLARDRVGVRPLYWAEHAGQLVFASEVKALLAAAPTLPRAFDADGLDQTFTLWTAVAPRTVFAGVSELPPGHVRVYREVGTDAASASQRRVWSMGFPGDFPGSLGDAADAVRAALEQATSLRMLRSDVEVGSYLSGGLDSSLIATMSLAAKGRGFHTFSLRFADAEYDEGPFQRLMSDRLGSQHHEVVVERADIAAAFPDVCYHAERPILRTAPAPMYLLSRLVRQVGVKVVLTGEGADEMFAGYDLFREGAVRRFWARAPASEVRPRLLDRLYPYLARSPVAQRQMARAFFGQDLARWREPGFAHGTRWRTTSALKRLLAPAWRRGVDPAAALVAELAPDLAGLSALAQDQLLEITTLMSGYLLSAQGDRMLAANSVEGRFPFLDRDVMALAGRLPDSYRLRGLDEKHVLKRLAADLIPAEIRSRPKQPYRAPDALALVGARWADALTSEAFTAEAGVFEPRAVTALWQKCKAKADSPQFSNSDNMAVVGVLSTHLVWQRLIAAAPVATGVDDFTTDVDRASF
ncbi:MAG: asparagine synthase (glutamine-hydrolyzing) [Kofleriaceae bacterium]|jgi:asparagine synthase (glutamine-hydrolysing)|nr:asparagine synthase (glutamine-hydrolyzing) [Kofleriaceae bacterium]MBP6837417.1 asparagine synthase (glutamine-hydrolyzing) [Kofleriaceae bacterium]